MRSLVRGAQNNIRLQIRTLFLIALASVAVASVASTLSINTSLTGLIEDINKRASSEITLRPADSFGLFGPITTISANDIATIKSIDKVTRISKGSTLLYRGPNLESSFSLGQLAMAFMSNLTSLGGPHGLAQMTIDAGGVVPIIIQGSTDVDEFPFINQSAFSMVSGRYLEDNDVGLPLAIIGEPLAKKNLIKVGDSLEFLNDYHIKVVGIFGSGQGLTDNMVVMPFNAMQTAFGLNGDATEVVATVIDVNHLDSTAKAIRNIVDRDKVELITDKDRFSFINGLLKRPNESGRKVVIVGMIVALAITFFASASFVKTRRTDIAILKVIGATNTKIITNYSSQTLIIGILICLLSLIFASTFQEPLASRAIQEYDPGSITRQAAMLVSSGDQIGNLPLSSRDTRLSGLLNEIKNTDISLSGIGFLFAGIVSVILAAEWLIVLSLFITKINPSEVLRERPV